VAIEPDAAIRFIIERHEQVAVLLLAFN
jgi:hypothetical protein